MRNLARVYLENTGQTDDDYYMRCNDLCDELVAAENNASVVYVDGDVDRDHAWRYHQVMMRDGFVHDAWHPNQIEATPLDKWLVDMFGPHANVCVAIDGDDVFEGRCKDFQYEALAKAA